MAKRSISPNVETARKILDTAWSEVLTETNSEINVDIDRLINSNFVAIRYSLLTQLLGKLTDNELDALCLQKGKGEDTSKWDPRGFSSKVIVPWVSENNSVLGSSPDPYVGKPLRKSQIEEDPKDVKNNAVAEWKTLYEILKEVEDRSDPVFTNQQFLFTLRSVHKRLLTLTFEYYVPERVSLDQTLNVILRFLSEHSGGDRGLSVAAALFETFGKYFGLYMEVRRNVINASDEATGLSGDIECIGPDGTTKLTVEVKERSLTVNDVRSAILKARKISLHELLFNVPRTDATEETAIGELINKTWASGTNLYRLSIEELIKVGLALTGEEGRRDFLMNVGIQLDTYNTQPLNRKCWKELLETL